MQGHRYVYVTAYRCRSSEKRDEPKGSREPHAERLFRNREKRLKFAPKTVAPSTNSRG